ncbi:hypothetical protein A9Q81_14470 [Gammaproteobacteria bacterium 42_54_T18]|nr:hypothetical protein A9Q81_14470 [Gammaproteobacteria bacterium 42_54_T18]
MVGIGDLDCDFVVYIGNRPPLVEYIERLELIPAIKGELSSIGSETGNHWRKIINIYAKLGYMLDSKGFASWQLYRENYLLTKGSHQALLFDDCIEPAESEIVRLICGKTHAATLLVDNAVDSSVRWVDADFAIDPSRRLIVTPYFDYRQLSNAKLETLVSIINSL